MSLSQEHTFFVGLIAAVTTGFLYSYSTWANALQVALDLSESQKETIGMAPYMANLVTFTTGLIIDKTSVQFGCILGGLFMFFAYGLYGAIALKEVPAENPVVSCFILGALGSYGGAFLVAAVFSVLTKNFLEARSAVVSIAKSWVGVSAGVGTAIFLGFFPTNDTQPERLHYLYFIAAVAGVLPICIAPFLRALPTSELQSKRALVLPVSWRLPFAFLVSLLLMGLTLVSSTIKSWIMSVVLLMVILAPSLLIVPRCSSARAVPAVTVSNDSTDDEAQQSSVSTTCTSTANSSESIWEGGPMTMIKRPEFYLLWWSVSPD